MKNFLTALDAYISAVSYYDDDTDETVIDSTEEKCYQKLMETDVFHFLGTEKVQSVIHIAFTDNVCFNALLDAYHAQHES